MMINVPHVAKLASLPLTDEESTKFASQLSAILDYVKQLEKVDTSAVEETSQITGLENVLREDKEAQSLTQTEALLNASAQHNGLFQVKGILDNE